MDIVLLHFLFNEYCKDAAQLLGGANYWRETVEPIT